MSESGKMTLMRVLIPTIFLAIMEAMFFFVISRKDIDFQVKSQYKEGNRSVAEMLRDVQRLRPDRGMQLREYVRQVNSNTKDVMPKNERTKKETQKTSFRNAVLIVLSILAIVLYLMYSVTKNKETIPWRHIIVQTTGSIAAIAAFQYYFYFHVGKKYAYTTPEEVSHVLREDLKRSMY